jgi:hypothetical protein
MPDGSIITGWAREISDSGGAPTVLGYQGRLDLACPVAEDVYQIFVGLDGIELDDSCIMFSLRTYTAQGIVAWEY